VIDFAAVTHLSFDCYGTLVDWERGLLDGVAEAARPHGVAPEAGRVLEAYARLEAEEEAGDYRPYREVLGAVLARLGAELGFAPSPAERDRFAGSVGDWRPFPDTAGALQRLASRFRLVILSNVDDDLFARTAPQLGVRFAAVITAQQLGSYKPAARNFEQMIERLGIEPRALVHVAQSLFHDHVPAQRLGLRSVWINRPSARPSVGVALPADVRPDLEFPDLSSFAEALGV